MIPRFVFKDSFTISPFSSWGERGASFGTDITVKGKLEKKRRLVKNKDGNSQISNSTLFCDYKDISVHSLVTIGTETFSIADMIVHSYINKPIMLELILL